MRERWNQLNIPVLTAIEKPNVASPFRKVGANSGTSYNTTQINNTFKVR
jgi:hypothetical protein